MTTTPTPSVEAMREALPCQMCGGKGFPRRSSDGDVEWVRCCWCGHEGPLRYSLTEAVTGWNANLPFDGVTIPADDGGEAITDAAKRMVAVQGMDWAELDGGDIGYWESLAAVALAAPKAPPVAQAEGVERLLQERIDNYRALMDAAVEAGADENGYALAWEALVRVKEDISALSATTEQGEGQATGTFACPICGQDTPHHHGAEAVDALQNKGSRK